MLLLPFWVFLWMVGWCLAWFGAATDRQVATGKRQTELDVDNGIEMGVIFGEEEKTVDP